MKLECPLALAIREAYKSGEEDERMEPRVLVDSEGNPIGRFEDGDSVIFYDLRGEREIELTESFTNPDFNEFPTKKPLNLSFSTLIEYESSLKAEVAFPPIARIKNTLSEVVSKAGLPQAKIVESEKAVHLSFFLNGKQQEPFPGEERYFIPTPKEIQNFDEYPEMEAEKVADRIIDEIRNGKSNLITANFANTDVLGHIENKDAIMKGVNFVDKQIGRIVEVAKENKIAMIITADHGTVEKWYYPDGQIDTGHTNSPVPFALLDFGDYLKDVISLKSGGGLTDVAPTVLSVLGLDKPDDMTGESLIENRTLNDISDRRVLLLIVDGWGYNENVEGNLIAQADTPNMDKIFSEFPMTLLEASGEAVGMPKGTVGNSEAGHLHIGAGRVIYSDRMRIDRSLADGSFYENEAFVWAMDEAKKKNKALHLLGIVSFYSSHGSLDHLFALMEMAKKRGVEKVFIHSFLGRRGERPEAGARYLEDVHNKCKELELGQVVDVIGRFWSLDREENWDRIEKTYKMLVEGTGNHIIT